MDYNYSDINIAFLHPRLEGGGAERVSLTMAQRLSEWGIRSHFISTLHVESEFVIPKDVNACIHLLPEGSCFETEANKQRLYEYLHMEGGVNIAFVCYLDGDFFVRDLRERLPSCQFIYWCHSVPFWERSYAIELGLIGAKISLRKWFDWHIRGRKRYLLSDQFRIDLEEQYRRTIQSFDRYIVLCPEYADELIHSLKLSQEERSRLLSITNTIEINPNVHLPKEKIISFVASVNMVPKRFDRMLRIWSRVMHQLPDWELKIYGTGHDVWLLDKLIKKYKLTRIIYCGYTTNLAEIYDRSLIVCLTSTFEGWPMVFAEAQNNGCIPIAFDCVSGIRSIIGKDEFAGILIPPYDEEIYAKRLLELCLSPELLKSKQEACLIKRHDYAAEVNDPTWHKLLGMVTSTR